MKAKAWVKELQRQASPDITIMIVANKSDLSHNAVSPELVQSYADEQRLLFFETSAKTGAGVLDAFTTLGTMLQIANVLIRTDINLAYQVSRSKRCMKRSNVAKMLPKITPLTPAPSLLLIDQTSPATNPSCC